MTIRMTPSQDEQLARLAERWGVSKNEAVVRAVEEAERASGHRGEVADVSREMIDRGGPVLDRLGSV